MVKFYCLRKSPGKKSVKSPVRIGINTNALCANVSSRQSKCHAFVLQIALLKELLALCKANDAKTTIVSVFTGAVFMNDHEYECGG